MYFVYIIECQGGSLYTGITTDVERRFTEHQAGKGANYTRAHKPIRIAYSEPAKDRATAQRREAEIKRLKRKEKLLLCDNK